MSEELAAGGAEAVVLVGSHARGDASPESDVDVLAIGQETFDCWLEVREGLLVSVSMRPSEAYSEELAAPEKICAAVPGWREAVVLHDPEEIAASLIRRAREWSWEPLEQKCDEWVAGEITSFAEEVHKLVAAVSTGRCSSAAIQRSLLAVHLAPVMAVHRRILYGSENGLWDLLSEEMGGEWGRAQSVALGLDPASFEETCTAALELYRIAASETEHLLDERRREVVTHARALADRTGGSISQLVDSQGGEGESGGDLHQRHPDRGRHL